MDTEYTNKMNKNTEYEYPMPGQVYSCIICIPSAMCRRGSCVSTQESWCQVFISSRNVLDCNITMFLKLYTDVTVTSPVFPNYVAHTFFLGGGGVSSCDHKVRIGYFPPVVQLLGVW